MSFSDLTVAVDQQPLGENSWKLASWNTLGQLLKREMLITWQILMAAKFRLQNRHRRLILHKICHFQPFPKFELSKKFSWGPPFAKMPKITDFSCLAISH